MLFLFIEHTSSSISLFMEPEHISDRDEFSVVQFYVGGSYDYLAPRFVGIKEAIAMAKRAINSFEAQTGGITRVIITDGGDCIAFEWEHGKGITL